MASEPKRRRINKAPPRRVVSSAATSKDRVAVAAPNDSSTVPVAQASGYDDIRIEEAKRYAVTQALQEGSTGNFRIFDSLYGNFLVPVIPTRAELAGTAMTCTVMVKGEELPSLGGESINPD